MDRRLDEGEGWDLLKNYIGIYPEATSTSEAERMHEESINRRAFFGLCENGIQFLCTVNDILGLGTELRWYYILTLGTSWVSLIMGVCEILFFTVKKSYDVSDATKCLL